MKGSDLVFNIGDKIIYGTEGVFVVAEYTASPIDKNDGRVFLMLRPVFGAEGNLILTPAEGGSVFMRAVMDRDAALALIDKIPDIGEVAVENERLRREAYRAVMSQGRGEDYVSIIKTVRRRRVDFLAQKRRISETDTDFETRAKRCLWGELSVALDISYGDVEAFIAERLGNKI